MIAVKLGLQRAQNRQQEDQSYTSKISFFQKQKRGSQSSSSIVWRNLKSEVQLKKMHSLSRSRRSIPIGPLQQARNRDNIVLGSMTDNIKSIEQNKNRFIIYPRSSLKIKWDIVIGCLILYSVMSIPYRVAFAIELKGTEAMIEIFWDILFGIDILINFTTGYYDNEERLVLEPRLIKFRYLKTWFIIDLLSTAPIDSILEYVLQLDSQLDSLKLLRTLRLIRLLKLIRLMKLKRLASSFETDVINPHLIRLARVMAYILFIAHLLACFWYMFFSWNMDGLSWITFHKLNNNVANHYLESLYWVSGSMMSVGYGDVYGVTDYERLYSMFTQCIGALCVGFIIANITMLGENFNPRLSEMKAKTSVLKVFLKKKNVPKQMRQRIIAQFDHYWSKKSVFDESVVLSELPRSFQLTVLQSSGFPLNYTYKSVNQFKEGLYEKESSWGSARLFPSVSLDFLLVVLPNLHPYMLSTNQILVESGNVEQDVFVIDRGYIEIRKDGVICGIASEGDYCGLSECFSRKPYEHTMKALTKCEVFSLKARILQDAIRVCCNSGDILKELVALTEKSYKSSLGANVTLIGNCRIREKLVFSRGKLIDTANLPGDIINILERGPNDTIQPISQNRNSQGKSKSFLAKSRDQRNRIKRIVTEKTDLYSDASLTWFEDMKGRKVKFICSHDSSFKMKFDIFIGIIIISGAILIPFRICFNIATTFGLSFYDAVTNTCLGVDLFLSFRTSFVDSDGVTVRDPSRIAQRYIRGMFLIDFCSTIPLDTIAEFLIGVDDSTASSLSSLRLIRTIRLVRLLKLIRILKLKKFQSVIEDDLEINPNVLRMLKLLLPMTFIAHYFGCFWYFLSLDTETENPNESTSWLSKIHLDDRNSITSKYIASIYWAFTTMTTVGYGDLTPTQNREKWYSVVIMISGATVFAYIVGSVSAIASSLGSSSVRVESSLNRSISLFEERGLPKKFIRACRNHLEHVYELKDTYEENLAFECLPPFMKSELIYFLHHNAIEAIPPLHSLSTSIVAFLIQRMKVQMYSHRSRIIDQGDNGSGIYFVISGTAKPIRKETSLHHKSATTVDESEFVQSGQFIGYRELLLGICVERSVVAVGNCSIYLLTKHTLENIGTEFPELSKQFQSSLTEAIVMQESSGTFNRRIFGLYEMDETIINENGFDPSSLIDDSSTIRDVTASFFKQTKVVPVNSSSFISRGSTVESDDCVQVIENPADLNERLDYTITHTR